MMLAPETATFPLDLKKVLEKLEISLINQAMERSEWNCKKAAEMLGIERTCLVMKRKKYLMPMQKSIGGSNE